MRLIRTTRRSTILSAAIIGVMMAAAPNMAGAAFKDPPVTLKGVDVYGTDAFTGDAVKKQFKHQFHKIVEDNLKFKKPDAQKLQAEIAKKLKAKGDFAYLDLSVVGYPNPYRGYFITVDAVDAKDKAARMPFRDEPTADVQDTSGALAEWGKYSKQVLALSRRFGGGLKPFDPKDCPVLYCVASFEEKELQPFLDPMKDAATKGADTLAKMALEDKNANKRQVALFLLAFTNDAAKVMPVLAKAIYDPDELVRNDAMLIMASIANKGIDVAYPVKELSAALDFPTTRGRNKAVAVIAILAKNYKYKRVIEEDAVPTLLKLLHLQQPNNHEWAYETLKDLSGKHYKDEDYDSWSKWAATIQS